MVDGEIIGYLIAQQQTEKNKFYINSVHILKDFQGIGIGKKLGDIATDKATDLGYKKYG